MLSLFDFQKKAVDKIHQILEKKPGCLLRANQGSGKTHMAAQIVRDLKEPTCWVGPAASLKNVEKKSGLDCTFVSYHKFKNIKKFSVKPYSFWVFDEAHYLRNWNADWTKRMMFLRGMKNRFLFVTATPILNEEWNWIYLLRKCGLFKEFGMDYIKINFFNAKWNYATKSLQRGEFINRENFMKEVKKHIVEIKPETSDGDIPLPYYSILPLDIEAQDPLSFKDYSRARLETGLKKVKLAVKLLKEDLFEMKRHRVSMILCHHHEVAKRLAEKLGLPGALALTKKKVGQVMDTIKIHGEGHLISTMGLTASDFDFNICDKIYCVESTFSFPLDQQSFFRARRNGKKTVLEVEYFVALGEKTLIKSLSRSFRETIEGEKEIHSKMGPSSLAALEKCPGSYWLPEELIERDPYQEIAAYHGSFIHKLCERLIKRSWLDSSLYGKAISQYVEMVKETIKYSEYYGVEDMVKNEDVHSEFFGTCDFWAYSDKTLIVCDLKTGNKSVSPVLNLQLAAYANMIKRTYGFNPEEIKFFIAQIPRSSSRERTAGDKMKLKVKSYSKKELLLMESKIKQIIDKVEEAESDPLKYIDQKCFNPFCRASKIHKQNRKGGFNEF